MELKLTQNLIPKNSTIAVALSGGKDSVCLLHSLINLQKKHPFTLKAINVEHGIRGNESISDTNFTIKLCKDWNIELATYKVDAPTYAKENKLSLEESARKLRYDCFLNAINSGFCQIVATAHHKTDLAETVLFNLFRGSGISGAKGIDKSSFDGKIIHPMLNLSQEDIEDYLEFHSLPSVFDSSNADQTFTRNYIRNTIVPAIKSRFPAFEEAIFRFSKSCTEDEEYFQSLAEKVITKTTKSIEISLCPTPIFKRASIIALNYMGIKKDYTKAHLDAILNLVNLQTGNEVTLPKNVVAIKENNKITFYKNTEKNFQSSTLKLQTYNTEFFSFTISDASFDEFLNEKSVYKSINDTFTPKEVFIDYDKIPSSAIVRSILEGDYITKFNGQTKSVKKFLTDKKINKTIRKNLLVLADGSEVLAIFGVEINPKVKIDKTTTNIIKISCSKFE